MDVISTTCTVDIISPEGLRTTFTSTEPQSDLLRVETQKDIGEVCGTFTLAFAPREIDGESWDERIPMRSLVRIRMDRPGQSSMPQVDTTVMLGLTDDHARSEQFGQAAIPRQVVVSGRELSAILIDAALFYHPLLLTETGKFGFLADVEMTPAWNPDLLQAGLDPRENLKIILEYFVLGGEQASADSGQQATSRRRAVINLHLPDLSLSDVLVLNNAAWTMFDEVSMPVAQNNVQMGSIYNYCLMCIDQMFQEFFTRIEEGVCKIHFRARPYKQEKVTTGSRFVEDAPTLTTIRLDPSWLLSTTLRRNSQAIYNVFWVRPIMAWNMLDTVAFSNNAAPMIITDALHPSSMVRYGIRLMQVNSPYLPALNPGKPRGTSSTQTASTGPLPTGSRIPTESLNQTQAQYAEMAAKVAEQEGVPAGMIPSFLANCQAESNWNPQAKSSAGAMGLGQLMPDTAQEMGVSDPWNPEQNLRGAARYWRLLCKRFNSNPSLVAAAYNAGPERIQNNQVPNITETKNHVARVNSLTSRYSTNTVSSTSNQQAQTQGTQTASTQATTTPDSSVIKAVELANRWSKILESWYDHGGQLAAGVLVVRGHPAWNIGHRLLYADRRGEREFYIEGVQHRYDMHTGMYTTTLRVTRGWYLQGASETQGSYKKPGAAANAATNKDVEVSFPQYDEEAQT
jgi:hypothetical protein